MKEKVLLLYHSGAGSTKLTSEILSRLLNEVFDVDIQHIDFSFNYNKLYNYNAIIFGFPTYHCEPSTSMMDFIESIPKLEKKIPVFFFTSYALYTCNCLRIFYDKLKIKNFKILDYFQFRSPASDGVLLFSSKLKFMFHFEKNYTKHLLEVSSKIKNYHNLHQKKKPLYKWYVPLNEILKYFGKKEYDKMRNNMHIIANRCTNCNLCVNNCERNSWKEGAEIPVFEPDNCEFCLECIHKCPHNAIIFSKKMKDKPRLDIKFFKNQKKDVFLKLND